MLLQLQPPTLWLDQLQLLSMPLLAFASVAGDTNDKPATNDNTSTKRLIMIWTSRFESYKELHSHGATLGGARAKFSKRS